MQVAVSGVSAVSHFHARRADLTLPADSGVTSISEVFTMTELKLFSARLRRLENHFRWIEGIALVACVLVAAIAVTAQVRGIPGDVLPSGRLIIGGQARGVANVQDEVRARHFVLVDDKGKERASLVSDNTGAVFLVMYDKAGKARVNLSVGNDAPALTFLDRSGQARTILGSTTAVPSHVYDNGIVELAPPSSIVLFDGKGKLLFRTP